MYSLAINPMWLDLEAAVFPSPHHLALCLEAAEPGMWLTRERPHGIVVIILLCFLSLLSKLTLIKQDA